MAEREHRNYGAIAMIAVACSIILLHSVVPHHDHDCCGNGLVFENELSCRHDHHGHECGRHDHDSDHHDGSCKLQDLLSQLVISTKDDKFVVSSIQSAGSSQQSAVGGGLLAASWVLSVADCGRQLEYYDRAVFLPSRNVMAERLRGPPTVA